MSWLPLVIVVAVWLVLASRWLVGDPRDDRGAVQSHQRALDRLRHVEGDAESSAPEETAPPPAHVRVLTSEDLGPRAARPAPPIPPTPVFAADRREPGDHPPPPDPPSDDDATPGTASAEELALLAGGWADRRRFGARRWGRIGASALLAAVVVVAGTVAASGWGWSGSGSGGGDDAAPDAASPRPESSAPPDVEAPAVPAVRLVASDGEHIGYAVAAASVSVTLVAHEPCWVQVRSAGSEGPVRFEATVAPGERHTFEDPAAVWLRLGNPRGVEVEINGAPVELPPEGRGSSPVDLEIRAVPDEPGPDAALSAEGAG